MLIADDIGRRQR